MRISHSLILKIIVPGNEIKIVDGQRLQFTGDLPYCPIFIDWRHPPRVYWGWLELAVPTQFHIAQPEIAGINHKINRLAGTHHPIDFLHCPVERRPVVADALVAGIGTLLPAIIKHMRSEEHTSELQSRL